MPKESLIEPGSRDLDPQTKAKFLEAFGLREDQTAAEKMAKGLGHL